MELSRRSVLQSGAGVFALGTLAGCLSEPDGDDPEDGYAAFFALKDWGDQVGGDHLSFETPLETGEMGHGQEPPGDFQRDIADSEVFIYLDTAEFDWARDAADSLETDYDHLTLIDGFAGLENQLLPLDSDAGDGADRGPDAYDDDPADVTVAEFDIYDGASGEEVGYWHASANHWHGGISEIPVGGSITIDGVFEDADGRILPLGEDDPFQLNARVADGATEGVLEIDARGDYIVFRGLETGQTRIVFELVADGEVVWDSSADRMRTSVVEDAEPPASYDPHAWVDPVLAQEMVSTIADGLADADPDNADVYEDNAAAYNERLEDVHRQFEELVDEADREVALLVGHDSFQYLENRYGFELYSTDGITPDAEQTVETRAETRALIDEHDIETVLYDPFEGPAGQIPTEAEELVEEGLVEGAEPLSPTEGTTQQWSDDGWGWVEQMEELNLPSLRAALGAD